MEDEAAANPRSTASPEGEVLDIASLSEEEREKFERLKRARTKLFIFVILGFSGTPFACLFIVLLELLNLRTNWFMLSIGICLFVFSLAVLIRIVRQFKPLGIISIKDKIRAFEFGSLRIREFEHSGQPWRKQQATFARCTLSSRIDLKPIRFLMDVQDRTSVVNIALPTPGEEVVVTPGPMKLLKSPALAFVLFAVPMPFAAFAVSGGRDNPVEVGFAIALTLVAIGALWTAYWYGGLPFSLGLTPCISTPEELRVHSWRRGRYRSVPWSVAAIEHGLLDDRSLARVRITSPASPKPLRILVTQEGLNTVLQHARAAGATITTRERKKRRKDRGHA